MSGLRRALTLSLGLAVALPGCQREEADGVEERALARAESSFGSVQGMRFTATATVVATPTRMLVVETTGHNPTREPRIVNAGGGCDASGMNVIVSAESGSGPVWTRAASEQAEMARAQARLDSMHRVNGGRRTDIACFAHARGVGIQPGETKRIGREELPIAGILGDSLPPGRYHVRVRLVGNGARAGILDAGTLELAPR